MKPPTTVSNYDPENRSILSSVASAVGGAAKQIGKHALDVGKMAAVSYVTGGMG